MRFKYPENSSTIIKDHGFGAFGYGNYTYISSGHLGDFLILKFEPIDDHDKMKKEPKEVKMDAQDDVYVRREVKAFFQWYLMNEHRFDYLSDEIIDLYISLREKVMKDQKD